MQSAVIEQRIRRLTRQQLSGGLRGVERERRTPMEQVMRRAQARGEIGMDRDIDLDIDALLGIIYFRHLIRGAPVTKQLAGDCVATWLAGSTSPA